MSLMSGSQYLPRLETFVADNGCYVMCMRMRERAAGAVWPWCRVQRARGRKQREVAVCYCAGTTRWR